MAKKTKIDKRCRMCIATATECDACKKKSHYKRAENQSACRVNGAV